MRRLLALAALIAALAPPASAFAYCRSSTCGAEGPTCNVNPTTSCSVDLPLRWPELCMSFDVATQASKYFSYATADAVLNQAFNTWTTVDCGGGQNPSIQIYDFGPVTCTDVGFNTTGGNANTLIFRDDSWPHEEMSGDDTLALTTVTFDPTTGLILGADIEVNTQAFLETTQGNEAALLGTLTHEAGHFLGLAHSATSGSAREPTMFWSYQNDEATLEADDVLGICTVYPPGRNAETPCTGIPQHGWAPVCLADQTYLGCAIGASASAGVDRTGPALLGFAAVAAIACCGARARRRSRRRRLR